MQLSVDGRYQLNNAFSGNEIKARFQTYSVTLGYIF